MMIEEPSLLALYGRFHPLVLHFPIALLISAAGFEVYRIVKRDQTAVAGASRAILIAGAVSALIAATMGLVLSVSGSGHEGETIAAHRFWGLMVAGLAILATVLRIGADLGQTWLVNLHRGALGGCVLAVFIAGHYGGAMTHGEDFISSAAPRPIAGLFGGEGEKEDVRLGNDHFSNVIEPILQDNCYKCHSAASQRGGLRLDAAAAAMAGGDSGAPAIVAGRPVESELVRRLFLPRDDKKAMPPDGRPRPSAEEIVALMDWITSGAAWAGENLAPAPIPEDALGEALELAEPELIAALSAVGAQVSTLSRMTPLLAVDLTQAEGNIEDVLADVTEYIAWVRLPEDESANTLVEILVRAPRLTRIDARNAPLNDAALKALSVGAKELRRINLVGTKVTSDGVRRLSKLEHLEAVYLWNSGVASADLEKLSRLLAPAKIYSVATLRLDETLDTAGQDAQLNDSTRYSSEQR